jgi:tetratricopeptide (TPR) repeat protein
MMRGMTKAMAFFMVLAAGVSTASGSEIEEALKALKEGGAEARYRAAVRLGSIGDASAIKPLVETLRDTDHPVRVQAESSLWKIWHRSGDEDADRMLQQGIRLMNAGDLQSAIKVFTQVIELDPAFAEGYNKRATALYLAGEYEHSIADCEATLALNPYHFGALSGEGLNYIRLDNLPKALEMFKRTQEILPYSESNKAYIETIEKRLRGKRIEL